MLKHSQVHALTVFIRILLGLTVLGGHTSLWAQTTQEQSTSTLITTLKQAFDAAWTRQPEAQSLELRQNAAEARKQTAESWIAAPPTLELSSKGDQITKNEGNQEYVVGVALPLWLPEERSRSGALAEAELRATASRALAAQIRTAAVVREAWWNWQQQLGEQSLARARVSSAQKLVEDVSRRVRAGDLALADLHQARGAFATAEAALAEANSSLAAARQRLRFLIGKLPADTAIDRAEPIPAIPEDLASLNDAHPEVAELLDRAEVARRVADLARIQTRDNPELILATTRDREARGEEWQNTITLGIRIPFGSESRNRSKTGLAHAEAIETESLLRLEREKLLSDLEASRIRVESTQIQLAAAEKRAVLARESKGFFDKSFRLGETDLPTRLRIELETVEAERQVTRTRTELASAISSLRQALGLLPE